MAVDAIREFVCPKTARILPANLFQKAAAQGLRAFAVLLVVIYHVWAGKVSDGVDVFLFISAFLFSLSFKRKSNEGKPLNNYWTPVFTRRLPAASVAILLILAGSLLVLSPTAWSARAVNEQASPGEQSGGGVL